MKTGVEILAQVQGNKRDGLWHI